MLCKFVHGWALQRNNRPAGLLSHEGHIELRNGVLISAQFSAPTLPLLQKLKWRNASIVKEIKRRVGDVRAEDVASGFHVVQCSSSAFVDDTTSNKGSPGIVIPSNVFLLSTGYKVQLYPGCPVEALRTKMNFALQFRNFRSGQMFFVNLPAPEWGRRMVLRPRLVPWGFCG